jgi:RNA polymerase sigma factor (sigma-70 family)
VGKKQSRGERPTVIRGTALAGASGPRGVAASSGAAPAAVVDVWPVPRLSKLRGFRTQLNDEQRELATRYVPLAESQAKNFGTEHPLDPDELRSTAYLALVEATRTFDPSRQVNFATFARHRIRGALRDYLRFATYQGWQRDHSPYPQFQTLSEEPEEARRLFGEAYEQPAGARIESIEDIERWLKRLPRTHALACRMIYLSGKGQDEVASLLGFSKSYLSRIHNEVLRLLLDDYNAGVLRGEPS